MNKWIALGFGLALSGCATAPPKAPDTEVLVTPQDAIVTAGALATAIDEEVLYLLMAAELAGQRNQYDLAMDAYLQAAKRVDDPRVAERAVKIGLFLKDDRRTQEALAVWLGKDSKNVGARKFAALLAIKNANRAVALENLSAMLVDDPAGFDGALLEMIKVFEKEGRIGFVYEVLESIAQQQPYQAKVLFIQALLASMLPDNVLAQEKITKTLALEPDWNKAIIFQAQLSGRSGDLAKARSFLNKAVKQAPNDVPLRKMLLEVLVSGEAWDEAIKLCQSVLEDRPDDADALFSLALIYVQQNQLDKAEAALEKLLANPEWDSRAALYLGKLEVERRRPDRALAWFDKVEPGAYAFDADMAAMTVLINQKRFDDAQQRLQGMEIRHPDKQLRLQMAKAELFNLQGHYQAAYEVLSALLRSDADNRDVLYARALVVERLDRFAEMEADLRKILQKNADDVAALNALGYALADRTERYDEADVYLARALELQPNEAVIIDSFGWLQFKKGNGEKALTYLRKAYQRQPETEIAAHLAEVLWTLGHKKEAKDFFESAFKKAPDDRYLLAFKRRFLQGD